MEKQRVTKTKMFRMRLTEHEQSKLEAYALKHGKSASQVIREYIWRLPNSRSCTEVTEAEYMNECSYIQD